MRRYSERITLKGMRLVAPQLVLALSVLLRVGASGQDASGQDVPHPAPSIADQAPLLPPDPAPQTISTETGSPAVQILRSFKDSDIKFNLGSLMDTLRDKRHEGWVLAAYPDPKTRRTLIGAGFTLDLPERQHPQTDPLNPHPFLEPSSADLWQAAGLDSDRLQTILDQYQDRFAKWKKRRFRQHIPALAPQITDEEATLLLRISAVQAIYNARAYCRNFDRMTGPQQMALSQLVYQIGVNLVRFDDFLSLVNDGAPASAQAAEDAASDRLASDRDYWKSVQHALMQTQWARLYRTRAIAVIAMLDPAYDDSPAAAEHLVGASLRPAVLHRRHGHSAALKTASTGKSRPHPRGHRKKANSRNEAS
jgi:GH24 family phage-related lysozyme (muramidase)